MPRVKSLIKDDVPKVNWLWAIILERMKVKHYTVRELAERVGCSYGSMRHYINDDPWNWPREIRERVCEYLGVNIIVTPKGIELEEKK